MVTSDSSSSLSCTTDQSLLEDLPAPSCAPASTILPRTALVRNETKPQPGLKSLWIAFYCTLDKIYSLTMNYKRLHLRLIISYLPPCSQWGSILGFHSFSKAWGVPSYLGLSHLLFLLSGKFWSSWLVPSLSPDTPLKTHSCLFSLQHPISLFASSIASSTTYICSFLIYLYDWYIPL